ncbi:MAG: ATPase [Clostridia bacterium]|nr:ATPase [Clostridia bacterium]
MAVKKVSALRVSGPVSRLDGAARVLLSSGVFSPETPVLRSGAESPARDDRCAAAENELLSYLPEGFVEPEGERLADVPADDVLAEAATLIRRLSAMKERAEETQTGIAEEKKREETLARFADADLDIARLSRMEFTSFMTGVMPENSVAALPSLKESEKIRTVRCSSSGGSAYVAVLFPKGKEEEVGRFLSGLGFTEIVLPAEITSVRDALISSRARIEMLGGVAADNAKAKSEFFTSEGERIGKVVRTLADARLLRDITKCASVGGDEFVLTGWVPKEKADGIVKQLAGEGVEAAVTEPDPETENVPVIIKNPRVFRPFEFFVTMFGTPSYGEIDPTPFVAITYILLFGIMFGDLGQGLLVSVVGYLMWRIKKMQLGRILIRCGISSAFFGLIYGSVFGFEHVLDPVYHALFGLEEKPIEVMAPATAGTIIYAAVGIGVALVALAMILNCFVSARRRDWGSLLFGPNGIPGLVFYGAVVWGLVSSVMLGRSPFSVPYVIFLIVLPLILIYLREPLTALVTKSGEKTEWGGYLAQSFFELFESVLSYVTNTMSFLRVGAFVLVHAGMMTVVFTLAGMTSGFAWWLIVVIGNIVVCAIEGLLVGIQVLRLEFYEMFSRFYEGGGRPFVPVTSRRDDE